MDIEEAKRASLGQVLFKCARLFNEQALERLRERTGLPLRAAHTALLPHVDFEGTRLTELARRMGVSKQAVHQLVGEMEAMGALERVPDPDDGRARLIRFSEGGMQGMVVGLQVLDELRRHAEGEIGVERTARLHEDLLALLAVLQAA
jgi:DNA-binding MarR family transcriptional regulator